VELTFSFFWKKKEKKIFPREPGICEVLLLLAIERNSWGVFHKMTYQSLPKWPHLPALHCIFTGLEEMGYGNWQHQRDTLFVRSQGSKGGLWLALCERWSRFEHSEGHMESLSLSPSFCFHFV